MREIDNSFRVIDSPNLMPESDDFELGDVATFAVVTESPAWIDALSREFSIGSPGYLAQLTEAWETIRWIKAEAEHNPWALQLIDNNFHDPNEAASSIIEITTNGGPLNRDLVRTIQRMLVSVESMSPFVNELYYQKINEEVEKS
ncbi:hypothetical protein H7Y40_02690 [Pedobacter sp.]|nr:hypothetical protein [Candidatus Saccharibacteria bacterium]